MEQELSGALITVPGTTRPHRVHSEFFNAQDSLAVEVNGQSRLANNVLLDGIDNNHETGLLTVLIPSADAIDTVSVTTSNYDAEFGRAGGAVTAVTLKSWTNQFKGSATVGGYSEGTIARNFFSGTKAPTKIVGYTFTFGGPLRQNRTFSSETTSGRSTTPAACSVRSFHRWNSGTGTSAAHQPSCTTRSQARQTGPDGCHLRATSCPRR